MLASESIQPLQAPVRTDSVVDTGGWWRRERIWLVVHTGGMLLWAPGPTPYCEKIDSDSTAGAFFNPITGCLVIPTYDQHRPHILRVPAQTAALIVEHYHPRSKQPLD